MIFTIVGFFIVAWALWARGGGNPANSAEIFRGPTGRFLNVLVILIGIALILFGIF
jgi:uncharacterized membrane protein